MIIYLTDVFILSKKIQVFAFDFLLCNNTKFINVMLIFSFPLIKVQFWILQKSK